MSVSFRVQAFFKGRLGKFRIREQEAVDLFACRLRQIRYQPQRNCEFIQLEVGTQEGHGAQRSRLSRHLHHLDTSLAQRPFRLCGGRRIVVRDHIVRDPLIQESSAWERLIVLPSLSRIIAFK